MARVMDAIVGSVGTTPVVQVKLVQTGLHAQGGLLKNTHASQILYVGGSTQSTVSSATGWPLAAGKSIWVEGVIDQSAGFYVVGSGAATTWAFLPSSKGG